MIIISRMHFLGLKGYCALDYYRFSSKHIIYAEALPSLNECQYHVITICLVSLKHCYLPCFLILGFFFTGGGFRRGWGLKRRGEFEDLDGRCLKQRGLIRQGRGALLGYPITSLTDQLARANSLTHKIMAFTTFLEPFPFILFVLTVNWFFSAPTSLIDRNL